MLRKILAVVLCILMTLSLFPVGSTASESELEKVQDFFASPEEDVTPEELYTQYAQQVLYSSGIAPMGCLAADTLSGNERLLYDALVPLLRQIASGQRASTVLAVGKAVTDGNGNHYPVDLEVTFPDNTFAEGALSRVIGALLADMPYELYWYDKVTGCSMFYFHNSRQILQFSLSFNVSGSYRGTDAFTVDTGKAGAPAAAAAYAQSIVSSFASGSDYEKLLGYKDTVCELTDYDYSAEDSGYAQDNGPWQLIHVFDQDPDTKVVCEGYAKAYQYLCDLTAFQADISCYNVSGYMDGKGHMWNIVSIDGSHYLTDITNSDRSAIGADGHLFLSGGSGSAADGYLLQDSLYVYDDATRQLWGTGEGSILNLSPESYQPEESSPEVFRIFGADRYDTAYQTADALKAQLGVEKFSCIIVASGTNFPDALAGTYLAARKDAPILLVKGSNTAKLNAYILSNLEEGGTLYLLGGKGVVPDSVSQGIGGITVKRLGGATRYDTNLQILTEAGVADEDIIVCTGKNFADSLSASAVGLPILLVKDGLTAAQKEFLSTTSGEKIIIGGTGAVSHNVENALKSYGAVRRIGGSNRYETSVLVAKAFFNAPTAAVLAYAQNFPDGLCGGPLAYSLDAPLILTATGKESAAAAYTAEAGIASGYILGGTSLISDASANRVFGRDPKKPIPLR